jgi:hypothetical protein
MPGAYNYDESEEGVVYTVTASLSDVDSFYSTQMPDLGWSLVARDDSTEGSVFFMYQKGSAYAAIGAVDMSGGECLVVLAVS